MGRLIAWLGALAIIPSLAWGSCPSTPTDCAGTPIYKSIAINSALGGSGTAGFPGGGVLGGTWTGNPTMSGNWSHTGSFTASPANLNVVLSPTGTGLVTIAPATAGTMDNMVLGGVTPLAGSFTTLTASSTVSGAGVTSLFASPPPIGSTATSTGAFTTLAASSTVSGTGFTNRFASPGPIGSSAASTGAFTTLSASSTVSGAGFDAYLASGKPGSFSTLAASGAVTLSPASAAVVISPTGTGSVTINPATTVTISPTGNLTLKGQTYAASGAVSFGSTFTTSSTFSTTGAFSTAGAFTTSGANSLTLTTTGNTNVTLPTGGTLLAVIPNYLTGVTLSNDGGTPNTVLDTAAGVAADSTNAQMITIGAFTKSTAGAWTSGTGNNGMGNGLTIANTTWYHVCLAYNGGTSDEWFDTSAVCANKPSGVSGALFRRLGSFKTDSSAHIIAFVQNNDRFDWLVPVNDIASNTPGVTTGALVTLPSVPLGVIVQAILTGNINDATNSSLLYLSSPAQTDVAAGVAALTADTSPPNAVSWSALIVTNTSQQIRRRVNQTTTVYLAITNGWIDARGK